MKKNLLSLRKLGLVAAVVGSMAMYSCGAEEAVEGAVENAVENAVEEVVEEVVEPVVEEVMEDATCGDGKCGDGHDAEGMHGEGTTGDGLIALTVLDSLGINRVWPGLIID